MELVITIIVLALAVFGGFSILAAITPNESDNKKVQAILSTINGLGMNILKAKNQILK
jgi:NADH:ubiquinone oxidoreductase subunit 3 (subunit A)|tara:strand:- start:539 stop:712 length:174 start_codon:yes stop_codon:yes gene_type:complete